ncbi:hypothetical protein JOC78_001247 [Bacillus ectoiniformans]|uniref:YwdI family protein n=1 Tax=Bacillus ectoiniformans TaxID=1494429 RepID=UPI00195D3380|nr:YwdI family protein [Bacillus ectoiniformans]MBM7648305.1 hypothetical protein [Bacillus ectoiniformans]
MNISHQSVLSRIEQEVRKAKQAEKSDSVKQHLYTIKTLCEVMLDTPGETGSQSFKPSITPQIQPMVQSPLPQKPAVTINQEEKLETEDGANGDSIFDF